MNGKHTPGPWLPSKFGFQVLTGDSWNTICALKGSAQWEDGRGTYQPEFEWQNQEANARLIAAAPDLLEALIDMFSGWNYIREQHGDLYGVGWDRCQNSAQAAIAKATGAPSPSEQEGG